MLSIEQRDCWWIRSLSALLKISLSAGLDSETFIELRYISLNMLLYRPVGLFRSFDDYFLTPRSRPFRSVVRSNVFRLVWIVSTSSWESLRSICNYCAWFYMSSLYIISSSILSFRLLISRVCNFSTKFASVCSVLFFPKKPDLERNIRCLALKYSIVVISFSLLMLVSALNC